MALKIEVALINFDLYISRFYSYKSKKKKRYQMLLLSTSLMLMMLRDLAVSEA